MRFKKRSFNLTGNVLDILLFLIGVSIIIAGYALQKTYIFSPDVHYLIFASDQLWNGGHYGKEIFETNPPMILFLYLPVILFKNLIFSNIHAALHWYVLMLGLISTAISYLLLKKLIPQDRFYRNVMILTFLFAVFIVPIHAFGQREHIFFILVFPYFLSVSLFLENKSMNFFGQLGISLMAGLGFAIKPFFVIPLVMVECYVLIKKKNIKAAFRLSNIVIFFVFVSYLVSIYIWQKGYFDIILPLVMKYYFPYFPREWAKTIFQENIIFCIAIIVSYFIFYTKDQHQNIGMVLCLGTLGALIAYIVPKQLWYYHFFPAFAFAFLTMMHLLKQLALPVTYKKSDLSFLNLLIFTAMIEIAAFFPINGILSIIFKMQANKKEFSMHLQNYVSGKKGERSVFCFSVFTFDCFSMMPESKIRFAESFPSFWWFNGLLKVEKEDPNNKNLIRDRKFLIDAVSDDLNHYQARWVIVNQNLFHYYQGKDFELMDYLSKNEKFKDAIKSYHYVQTIGFYKIYERERVKISSIPTKAEIHD